MISTTVQNYHQELKEWSKSLEFYATEIQLFETRLLEVVNKNTKMDLLSEIEHFQDQFIIQKEQFDLLQLEILAHERGIKAGIFGGTSSNNISNENMLSLKNKVQVAENIFGETRKSFYQFLSKVF